MTYFTLNHTKSANLLPVLPPGREEAGGSAAVALSNAHIRRKTSSKVIFREGSSFYSVSRPVSKVTEARGVRSSIKGFSTASRRRLLYKIAGIRRDAELPCFVTLTYPNEFPTIERAKRDLKIFIQRLKYKFSCSGIWKLEPQERGAPHYHCLIWGVDEGELLDFVAYTWYEIAGNGDRNHLKFHLGLLPNSKPCVSKVRSWRGVWAYASKYLGKTFEVAGWEGKWTGRFWGSWGDLPQGELRELEIPDRLAIISMRYQRRFSNLKRFSPCKVTTFCDADQWFSRVIVNSLWERNYR